MERRRHPTYDRKALRPILLMASSILVSCGIAFLSWWWQVAWLSAVVLVPFLVLMGLGFKDWGVNSCPCPGCSSMLHRVPNTTEFVCPNCQVVWWTRTSGESIWDKV